MDSKLFHPDFLSSLNRFFSDECTIQEPLRELKESGHPDLGWDDLYVAIPCAFGKEEGAENRTEDYTFYRGRFRVILQGLYSDITGEMRAKINGVLYNILYPIHDYRLQKTSLVVELIKV